MKGKPSKHRISATLSRIECGFLSFAPVDVKQALNGLKNHSTYKNRVLAGLMTFHAFKL